MTELTPAEIEVRRASVQFSRRIGRSMKSRLFMSYTAKHRAKIMNTIMALGNFGTFEQLPDWLQQAIIQSESPSTGAGYEETQRDASGKLISGAETRIYYFLSGCILRHELTAGRSEPIEMKGLL
jgi:hypothetical protein